MSDHISPLELAARMASAAPPHLLDVREPDEHKFVALPGSKLIPLGQLFERAGEIAHWREEPVVVYCHHGIRSRHAMAQLQRLGFTQLQNLSGGIAAWSAEVDATLPQY